MTEHTNNNRPQPIKKRTPKGIFQWPKITEPDYGTKEYPKEDGEYSVTMLFDASDPEFQRFRKEMEKAAEKAYENGRREFAKLKPANQKKLRDITEQPVFEEVYDEDGNETGTVKMKVRAKAGGVRKRGPKAGTRWSRKIPIFDARGQQIRKPIEIWGGTVGKVSFEYLPDGYFIPATGLSGISLQLTACQIIELVSGGERNASDFGFEEEEGGFDASSLPDEVPTKGGDDSEDTGGGADDYGTDDDPGF